MNRVLVLNGPNLNLLGTRQPEIYGTTTLVQLDQMCREWGTALGLAIESHQSNHEGDLIDRLHVKRESVVGVVINAGAFTHYSYALHDALEAIEVPAVEVHISNIKQREPWRHHSVIAPACAASIYGRGIDGYRWALRHLAHRGAWPVEEVEYGDQPDHVADLRLPSDAGPHPVAVLIHGGFWQDHWQRDTLDGIAVALARAGVATWNIEYRRAGSGGGWPTTGNDVAQAIEHLSEMASDHHLDMGRVAVLGHSAGGQLALATAARTMSVDLTGVIALAPITDLTAAHEQGLGQGAVERFFGSSPDVDGVLWPGASPLDNLPLGVRQIVIHGDADDRVPLAMSRAYTAAAAASSDAVELKEQAGVDHFAPIDPASPAWPDVESAVISLL